MKKKIMYKLENLELRWARTNPNRYISFLKKKGIKIGAGCKFYSGLSTVSIDITRPSLVEIGDNVLFNKNFKLVTHDYASKVFIHKYNDFVNSSGKIKIGNNVSFGMDCTVLKGVTIGDNCFIGVGSIVTHDIPSDSIAIGSPAKIVCSLDDYYKKRKSLCVAEAFEYARSIKERFNRIPVINDFWEEFPLFLNGDENCSALPIKKQLGPAYEHFIKYHKATFAGFDDFLKQAGLIS
jgi:acetyltransferase-like isoleucine patch superfamily enzyme